jgi:hypothetical protein
MRFLILCPSRSGSTMLRMSLTRHPKISCHGEILGMAKPWGLNGRDIGLDGDEAVKLHRADPAEFLRRAFGAEPARGKAVFGFKMIYRQMEPRMEIVRGLAADPEVRLVHLWRRDLCDRFLSHKKYALAARAGAVDQEIRLEPAELIADVQRQQAFRAQVLEMFSGHPILEVVYEDLLAAGNADPVVAFLGQSGEAPLAERRAGKRVLPKVVVINEAELRAVYAGL